MKTKILQVLLVSLFCGTVHAQTTAFTYQGRLNANGAAASGNYDLQFSLQDALSAGNQIGGTLTSTAVAVTNGLFTASLDFGVGAFPGADRWLEISVRTNGAGGFTTLTPRQKITATPYAVAAATLTGTLAASQLSGTIANASLPASPNVSGTVTANSFSGNGAGLTALNAGNISSGTADINISGNATTATSATSFSGSLAGNVTGTQGATVVSTVGGQSAANVASGASAANAATSANTPGTIVKRDGSGNISAGTITGNFSGNGAGLTNVNLMTALPAYAITLTTNSVGGLGFSIASAPLVGTGPVWAAAADVNGDGKVDLISANFGNASGNTLSVLTNNGSGGFVLASSPTVGTGANSVAAADVNGDGKVDLISANFNAATLSVLTNNGSGGFVIASSLAVGAFPNSVTAADVNGDSKMDLICSYGNTNTLSVLTNKGGGIFVLASSPTVGSSPSSVAAADLNGDTTIDLITSNYGSNTLSVLFGTGTGTFVLHSSPVIGTFPNWVTTADVNGDGKMDLVSVNLGDNVLVLTNNGGGTFGSNSTFSAGSPVTASDVNGDGKVDLIGANANTLSVFTNNGVGGFTLASSPTVGDDPRLVLAADVNGDNNVDLISANYNDSTMTVLFNTLSTVTTTATLQGNFTGSTLNISGILTAGSFVGNGSGLTNVSSANFTGSLSGNVTGTQGATVVATVGGQTAANVASGTSAANAATSANTANTIVKRDAGGSFSAGGITGTNFTGNAGGLTNLNATNLIGTIADGRLSANVAMNNGAETFAGNVTINGFPIVSRTSMSPTNTATLTPTTGYVLFSGSTAVTLNATTAIANGAATGSILILQGGNITGTVTVPDGANTQLGAASRLLGLGDTLTLIWDGGNWTELSYVNN